MKLPKEIGKYIVGIGFLYLAVIITVETPLFDQSRLLLPFSAVLFSFILFGKGQGIVVSILALLAIDYFLIGPPRKLYFDTLYVVEAILFFILGFLISRIVEARKKADKELLRLKDEFIFTTAHDLRSPFQLITLILEKHKFGDVSAEETKKDMMQIQDTMGLSLNLISKLLALAKGEDPYKEKAELDLQKVIQQILDKWEMVIKKKNIKVTYEKLSSLVNVVANPTGLEEIFDNLIGNAIKYNKEHGSITIGHTLSGNTVTTIITDTGIGIPEDNLSKIFLPYYRSNQTKASGTGLGLYIVKKIVDQLNGSIEAESQLGKGTTFRITLPSKPV